MLRSLDDLQGYSLNGPEGRLGTVTDLLFDDDHWLVRYLQIEAGTWLLDRRLVIVPPTACETPEWLNRVIPSDLTRAQVAGSPQVDIDATISRDHERRLADHYGWTAWWDGAGPPSLSPVRFERDAPPSDAAAEADASAAHLLRSVKAVTGYSVAAVDGDIGHVADLIAETDTWAIRYLVIDTGTWLPGRKVLVGLDWVTAVRHRDNHVAIDHTRDRVREAPPFDPSQPVGRAYVERLYDYYGRPSSPV